MIAYSIEIDGLKRDLKEARLMLARVWDIYGSPSYESLKGRSIYDLIQADRFAARALQALLNRDICYVGNDAVLPFDSHYQAINHVAEARRSARTSAGDG